MREGGCRCGAVRYRVEGEPSSVGICHCETCRRAASAPTLPFAVVAIANFAITQGTPVDYRSSPSVIRGFCGECGSPLTYFNEDTPTTIDIMTGSLDDPDSLPPSFSVWVDQKLGWDVPAADIPAYPTSRSAAGIGLRP